MKEMFTHPQPRMIHGLVSDDVIGLYPDFDMLEPVMQTRPVKRHTLRKQTLRTWRQLRPRYNDFIPRVA